MPALQEHAINIFIHDGNGRPIPGARIQIFDPDEMIAEATYKGRPNAPTKIQVPPAYSIVRVKAFVESLSREATVDVDVQDVTLTFDEITMPDDKRVPAWFAVAGYAAGVGTLLFFMYLSLTKVDRPTFAHLAVMSLGVGLSFTFVGGDAAAKGKLPLPGGTTPLTMSVSGGMAAMVVTFVLAKLLW